MRWDLFCQVIDNHGDLGVCWRLARQLHAAGEQVRLWLDDARALHWMAPEHAAGHSGIDVLPWGDARAEALALQAPAPEVLIEAFGCEPAAGLIAHFAERARSGAPHAWINLEYLSAERFVESVHGLPSPVFSGPGAGLSKRFFYPGFTPATGGLLRETDLNVRQATFQRADWLRQHNIPWQGERLLSLFCYEPAGLAALIAQLAQDAAPTRLLVTPGRATQALQQLLSGQPDQHGALALNWLPHLPQPGFDELLWACDLNFVRGEDSLVRALWAPAPLIWHIYPQDDQAHHDKLDAWLDWLQAPASLRAFHHAWNGMGEQTLRWPDAATLGDWRRCFDAARTQLLAQDDLLSQLRRAVKK